MFLPSRKDVTKMAVLTSWKCVASFCTMEGHSDVLSISIYFNGWVLFRLNIIVTWVICGHRTRTNYICGWSNLPSVYDSTRNCPDPFINRSFKDLHSNTNDISDSNEKCVIPTDVCYLLGFTGSEPTDSSSLSTNWAPQVHTGSVSLTAEEINQGSSCHHL